MKPVNSILLTVAMAIALGNSTAFGQTPMGTEFTYLGLLKENGSPHPGSSAQMVLDLYNDRIAGMLLGTVGPLAVPVTSGLFTVVRSMEPLPVPIPDSFQIQVLDRYPATRFRGRSQTRAVRVGPCASLRCL